MRSTSKVIAIPARSKNRGITANLDSNRVGARRNCYICSHAVMLVSKYIHIRGECDVNARNCVFISAKFTFSASDFQPP